MTGIWSLGSGATNLVYSVCLNKSLTAVEHVGHSNNKMMFKNKLCYVYIWVFDLGQKYS